MIGFCLSLTPITLHIVLFPRGTLSFKCLLSIHIRWAPTYKHSAGSMCLVPTITLASPHVVIIRCLMCSLILWCAFLATELVISVSIIIVCLGGSSLLLIGGCAACICVLKMDALIELHFLFLGQA